MPIIILLVLIIAIYYIVAHQWYKQIGLSIARLRTAGLPTTPAEYTGEPVPDEDNSAPIFKEIDQYIAQDNERHFNEQQVLEFFESRDHRAEVWDRAKELVNSRSSLFALIEEAVKRPHFWVPCEPTARGLLSSYDILPEATRHSVRMLVMRSILRAADGDADGAVSDVIASLSIGSVWSNTRCTFGFMARAAMINISLRTTVDLLEYCRLEERHIQRLYDEFSAIDLNSEHAAAVRGETAFLTSAYQYGKKLIFMPYTMYQTTSAIAALERQLAVLDSNHSEATGPELLGGRVSLAAGAWGASAVFIGINLQKYMAKLNLTCLESFLLVCIYQAKHDHLPESLEAARTCLGEELVENPFTTNGIVYKLTDQGFELQCPGSERIRDAFIKAHRNQFGKWNYDLQLAAISTQPLVTTGVV